VAPPGTASVAPLDPAAVPPPNPVTPAPLEEVLVTSPEPRYVAPTTRDRIGRIWAPVLVNGKGPYRLVLDTGASRSALVQRVVDELALPVQANAVRLRGVTGTAIASAVRVETFEVGELAVEDSRVPIVADAFGGADGILGIEGLDDKRITIEFKRDRITIMRSHRQAAPSGYVVVPFRNSAARGMRVQANVGSIKVVAVIDTGAQVTVGNLALREALAKRRGERDQFDDVVVGITEDIQQATRARIPSIVAGNMIVRNAEIHFGDLHIFEHWHLESQPAVLVGMDVLGTLETLVIDYKLRELQLRTRH
jgi:predicted aspartyl protease